MIEKYCIIDQLTSIGQGTVIRNFVEIRAKVTIGEFCEIDSHCCFTGESTIGNNVTIRNHCVIARGVEIGDNTYISPQCMFNNLDTGKEKVGGAKIGKNCFIGTNVTFKEGITVCDDVIIGSKALVTKDITEPGTYVGVPAKKI